MGTDGFMSDGKLCGRILVFSLKKSRSPTANLVISQPGSLVMHYPVNALLSFGPYLLASSGKMLYQIKIEQSTRQYFRTYIRIIKGAEIHIRNNALAIQNVDSDIYIGTKCDSLCIVKFHSAEKKFSFVTKYGVS